MVILRLAVMSRRHCDDVERANLPLRWFCRTRPQRNRTIVRRPRRVLVLPANHVYCRLRLNYKYSTIISYIKRINPVSPSLSLSLSLSLSVSPFPPPPPLSLSLSLSSSLERRMQSRDCTSERRGARVSVGSRELGREKLNEIHACSRFLRLRAIVMRG